MKKTFICLTFAVVIMASFAQAQDTSIGEKECPSHVDDVAHVPDEDVAFKPLSGEESPFQNESTNTFLPTDVTIDVQPDLKNFEGDGYHLDATAGEIKLDLKANRVMNPDCP